MALLNLVLPSGGAVSSQATIRGGRAAVIMVSSVASQIGVAFQPDSGSVYFPLLRSDGSGLRFVVCSGAASAAVIERPPTQWLRLEAIGGTFAATTSAFITDAV